ncbi:hypothetical protein DFH06DRAFT_1321971 [Mycena polygramma]|nr:hypothetical protein DFH06DRAFT_1321971 [Mycena polygramma]
MAHARWRAWSRTPLHVFGMCRTGDPRLGMWRTGDPRPPLLSTSSASLHVSVLSTFLPLPFSSISSTLSCFPSPSAIPLVPLPWIRFLGSFRPSLSSPLLFAVAPPASRTSSGAHMSPTSIPAHFRPATKLLVFLRLGQAIRPPPWLDLNRINIYQYYSAPPATQTAAAPPAQTAAAPPAQTPAAAPTTNPVLSWAPANVVPATPAQRCAPNRCAICDAQHLCVLHQANGLNGPQTGPLPHRRTCEPIFLPADPSIDVITHSLAAGESFYLAMPAHQEAIYTNSITARAVSEGVQHGKHQACKTWEEAKALWALGCLRWHGNECRRERLQRADGRGINWAVAGTSIICGSRAAAFRLAQDSGSLDIRIRGHRDAAVLRDWLDNGSSEED